MIKVVLAFLWILILPEQGHAYSIRELRSVETQKEEKLRELREAEVRQIRVALGRRLPKNRRAELYFRLAESYLESYRATFLLEGRVHQKRLDSGRKGSRIHRTQSKKYLKKGIEASEALLELKIPYQKMDHVYYFLAFYHEELGNQKKSKRYYRQLLQKYPRTSFAVEAYREMGNEAYEKRNYRKAIGYFNKVIDRGEDARKLGVLPEVLYRLSWSYYRTRRYSRAIQVMKQAVSESKKNDEKFISVSEEAFQALAIFMTERGQVDQAIAYFREHSDDPKKFSKILKALGAEYERTAKPKKAIQVYEAILKTEGAPEIRFETAVHLVELEIKRNQYQNAIKRLQTMNLKGEVRESPHYKKLKSMIRRKATGFHTQYRKSKRKKDRVRAQSYYEAYMKYFLEPDSSESNEIKMYLAEIYQASGQSRKSAELYRDVLQRNDQRYSKEAGALWAQSLWDSIKLRNQKGKNQQRKSLGPSDLERQFVQASDQLSETIPGSEEAQEAELKSAQILAGYPSTLEESQERARKIIKKRPQSKDGQIAALLLLQTLEDRVPSPKQAKSEVYFDRVTNLREVTQELEQNQKLMAFDKLKNKSKLSKKMSEIRKDLRIGSILVYEKSNDYLKAAAAYESFALRSNSQKLAEKAYQNALDAYLKSNEFSEAQRLVFAWENRFSKSKNALESMRSVATQFLILGQWERSAHLFEYLGKRGNDRSALMTAGRVFHATGEIEKWESTAETLRKIYGVTSQFQQVSLELGNYFFKQGEFRKAIGYFRQCRSADIELRSQCIARFADSLLELGDREGAKEDYERVGFKLGRKSLTSPYVGYARFQLALKTEKEAQFEPLALPDAQLQRALQQRLEFFERISKIYRKAAEAGGPWGIASLSRLARWSLNFAEDVDRINPPDEFSEEQKAGFRKTLRTVSLPIRTKAIETLRSAYRTAVKDRILSSYTIDISHDLSEYQKGVIAPAQGGHWEFRLSRHDQTQTIGAIRKKLLSKPDSSNDWLSYGNALYRQGEFLLAKLSYERALDLDGKSADARNNLAVVSLKEQGVSDWLSALQAKQYLRLALSQSGDLDAVRWNIAHLYDYYRLFGPSSGLWRNLLSKERTKETYLGSAMNHIALRKQRSFQSARNASQNFPGEQSLFLFHYSNAVSHFLKSTRVGMEKCGEALSEIPNNDLIEFEKKAYQRLKRTCDHWKTKLKE